MGKSEAFVSIVCYHLIKKSEKNTVFLDLRAFGALLLICGNNLKLFRFFFFNAVYKINLSQFVSGSLVVLFFFLFTIERRLRDEEAYLSQFTAELLRPF